MTQRTDRIDELIRQEIGAIVARDIADPRIGFVTVTDVETAPDLSHAKVWVSFIGSDEERKIAMGALGRAMPFIRHELGKRLRIRRIPELHLQADDTLVRGTRVLQLLNELRDGADPTAEPEGLDLPTPVARLPHEGDAEEPIEAEAAMVRPALRKGQRRPGGAGSTGKGRKAGTSRQSGKGRSSGGPSSGRGSRSR